jgi:opacity protein-like surface antigen
MRKGIAGRARRNWLAGAMVAIAAAAPLGAQGTGNGYLFGAPSGGLSIRGGWFIATASSDFYEEAGRDLTLGKSDFSAPTIGVEAAFRLTSQLDLTFDGAWSNANPKSHYRDLVDNNNQEIEQSTSLRRVPLTANLKMYLAPRGRSVGSLAYIPAKVVPWVGIGGGATWYKLRQTGDFVNKSTNAVVAQTYESSGWGPALQGMGGVDFTLTPRIALTGDARYLWSRASMTDNFEGLKIDLSGVSVALGLTFRL